MNPDKFKSVAINIKTYHLLEELSQKKNLSCRSLCLRQLSSTYKKLMRITKLMAKNLNKRLEQLEQSREQDYGSFNRNMKKIAAAWSILLDPYLKQDIPAHMIPLMYAQAKLVRATHKFKEDTYDDALAYIVQSHDMHKEKSEEVDTDELLGVETKPRTKW